eukprot:14892894-Alexandrium_andersonii.AAC.1
MRDLGSHLRLAKRLCAPTLSARIAAGARLARSMGGDHSPPPEEGRCSGRQGSTSCALRGCDLESVGASCARLGVGHG